MHTKAKEAVAREVWLEYFNRTLYERGIITEDDRNRMTRLIQSNTQATTKLK